VPADRSGGPDVLGPARLGPLRLPNRIIKAATFEGLTPHGLVTDELIAFHRRVAAGGVGMTTLAYCAVAPEGRTERRQIVLSAEAVPGLRRLADAVHGQGAAVSRPSSGTPDRFPTPGPPGCPRWRRPGGATG